MIRRVRERDRADERWSHRYRMLVETLRQCGVDMCDDDHEAAEHIARWEGRTALTIASWIARATAAGRGSGDVLP